MTFQLNQNSYVKPCPKCGNNTKFTAISKQVMKDGCNVWVECKCGFDPTEEDHGYRYESVWGGTSKANVQMAIDCWNYALEADKC